MSGIAYTFYSFKGGAGRSMALANVAALLAKWGRRVLIVDWDLEAPGLENFFPGSDAVASRARRSGIVDLILAHAKGRPLRWQDCVIPTSVGVNGAKVELLSAGRSGDDYSARLQRIDFDRLFEKNALGRYIEELRNEWLAEYDYVLIDSRTGVTDIGGICTVQLADVLVLMVTTTMASLEGCQYIVKRARELREKLPVGRNRLVVLPVPARDESRTEYKQADIWRNRFAESLADLYADWLPVGVKPREAIDTLRIPYVPYWSFGEPLPAIEEGTTDPSTLGYAYFLFARLLDAKLDWHQAMEGRTAALGAPGLTRSLDVQWIEKQRQSAGYPPSGGFMEIYHACLTPLAEHTQAEILTFARQAAIHTFGWPIGLVLENNPEGRPRPTRDGIMAQLPRTSEYWAQRNNGDFYSLMPLFEDSRAKSAIIFNTRIVRTTETLLRCAKLYQSFRAPSDAEIEVTINYGGIKGRRLRAAGHDFGPIERTNQTEDFISATVKFRLASLEDQLVELVRRLCDPLFVLFDFAVIPPQTYERIVREFQAGKVV